jgi:hypothetical protein
VVNTWDLKYTNNMINIKTKYTLSIITLLISINILYWLSYGEKYILMRAADVYSESCSVGYIDSLYIYEKYDGIPKLNPHIQLLEFDDQYIQALVDKLRDHDSVHSVIFVRRTVRVLENKDEFRFGSVFNMNKLMLAENLSWIETPSGTIEWRQKWLWLYGWRKLGNGASGCS